MADVRAWEDVNEDEDEEAMKLQYYGITDIEGITGKVRGDSGVRVQARVGVRPYKGGHRTRQLQYYGITDTAGISGKVCNVGVIDQARGGPMSGLGFRVRVRAYQGYCEAMVSPTSPAAPARCV